MEEKSKRKRLLTSAYELFTTKGINKTTIQDIVDAARVAKGTFYLYFEDKYKLQEELVVEKSEEIMQMYEEGKSKYIRSVSFKPSETLEEYGIYYSDEDKVKNELKVYLPYEKNIDNSYSRRIITYDIKELDEDKIKSFFTDFNYFKDNYSTILGAPRDIETESKASITNEELEQEICAEAKILSAGREKTIKYFDSLMLLAILGLGLSAYFISDNCFDCFRYERKLSKLLDKYDWIKFDNSLEIKKAILKIMKSESERNLISDRYMTIDEIEKLAVAKNMFITPDELSTEVQNALMLKPIKKTR